ncbi:MAG: cobalamin-dependent protein, partial [Candidatus Poribacteria bacterium]
MKNILLVAPEFKSPGWDVKTLPFIQKKALIVPLHLATIAALTPDDIEVDLWDEFVHGRISEETTFDKEYDLVGITSHFFLNLRRAKEIAQVFRRRGILVAIGGADVSFVPEQYRDDFDVLFIGEAELTWPKFIADFLAGSY